MEADYFSSMPPEIIEIILGNPKITLHDMLSMCLTCRYFHDIINSRQSLWKKKLFAKWPFMRNFYKNRNQLEWLFQVRHIMETQNYCKNQVKLMSSQYRWRRQAISYSDLEHYINKAKENDGLAFYYLTQYLKMIINLEINMPSNNPHNYLFTLTDQHYAKQVYVFVLQHYHLKKKWFQMIQHETTLVPDRVAIFALQWLFPRNGNSALLFAKYIEDLVGIIESRISPDHPLMRVHKAERKNWSENLLEDNQLSVSVCKSLFRLLSTIIFEEHFFHVKESFAIESLNIHDMIVYENSHKYLTFILYESVARRCGIRCDISGSGNHLFLYWRENWSEGSPKFIVNIMEGCMKLSLGWCPYAVPSNASPSPEDDKEYSAGLLLSTLVPEVNDVIQAFELNIVTYTLELLYAVLPGYIDNLKFIAHLYVLQKKDLRGIVQEITTQLNETRLTTRNREELTFLLENANKELRSNEESPLQKINIKTRTPKILFAIGMVCHHKLYEYKCMLIGWDPYCQASAEWQQNMGVLRLKDGPHQPFYHALAEDGSQRYVAQENLEFIRNPYRLLNVEEKIAIDFTHFNGFQYVPNEEKKREYPNDLLVSDFFQNRSSSQ